MIQEDILSFTAVMKFITVIKQSEKLTQFTQGHVPAPYRCGNFFENIRMVEQQAMLNKIKVMTQLQLHCPSCSALVHADDINIATMVAKCGQCHTVFSFADQFPAAASVPVYSKPEILMPVGIEVLRMLSELQIEISWRKTSNKFFLFFTALWNAIVIPMAVVIIMTGELKMLLFLSIHLSVGLGFLYASLTTLLNTTYISVNSRRLVVEHKPLWVPFNPGHDVSAFDIKQLYAIKYEQGKSNGRPVFAYSLHLALKNGQDLKLLKGLKTPDQAQYIEQEIERFLKISDEMVEGEYRM